MLALISLVLYWNTAKLWQLTFLVDIEDDII